MLLQLSAQFMDLFLYVVWLGASSVSTPTIISATQTPLAPTGSSWDPAIVAAVIGAVAALVAALIVVGVAIYQTRQSHKIEREKDEQQRRHEQEMERYRRELDLQYRGKE